MSEIISIREFARRVGVSDTAIHKAIKSGKIVSGLGTNDKGRPVIDFDTAIQEWKAWAGGAHAVNYEAKAKPEPKKVVKAKPAPAPKVEPEDEEEEEPQPKQSRAAFTPGPAPDTGTLVAAKKAQAVYIAKIKELEYKKMAGSLVDKDSVYKALFAFGQEMRNAFQALPDRIIDELLATSSRNEAHKLLYDSIADVLEKLSSMDDKINV